MNENFVPFETAKKLKEKGFREKCFAHYYCSDKAFFERNDYDPDTNSVLYCYNNDEDLGRFYIDAPTISQVLKWLREKKHKFVCVEFFNYEIGFGYKLIRLDYVVRLTEKQRYKTYEEAAIAGIEYVIDNNLI